MPRDSSQKRKLLVLADIFRNETDEEHPLSIPELTRRLGDAGIAAERKSLYSDIETLTVYGMDIEKTGNARATGYYLAARDFELPELKLLADAVACSRFITERKSAQLIKKLGTLANRYDAGELKRNVVVYDRIKNGNEQIYYNIDAIQRAIREKKKIRFLYFDYDRRKTKKYHNDGNYSEVSPYALCWREDNYYLVGYYPKYEAVSSFRVDKIERTEVLDLPRNDPPKDFDLAEYTKKRFGMYSGEDVRVTLRVHNSLSGVILDRFGRDAPLSADGEEYFRVSQVVTISPILFGWLFQFGDRVEVLSPKKVRDEYRARLREALARYDK
ncbi:MAG: WYL domain-containing protein [Bacteroides sp.]|nr:WYL domain-containing protein [Eubacterium sp.]MCM1419057.1 WYL domain-containing protein [Roseburia sp.]MCM1461756.1 WYL domain-containing protein [Bacteroides sp.]